MQIQWPPATSASHGMITMSCILTNHGWLLGLVNRELAIPTPEAPLTVASECLVFLQQPWDSAFAGFGKAAGPIISYASELSSGPQGDSWELK